VAVDYNLPDHIGALGVTEGRPSVLNAEKGNVNQGTKKPREHSCYMKDLKRDLSHLRTAGSKRRESAGRTKQSGETLNRPFVCVIFCFFFF